MQKASPRINIRLPGRTWILYGMAQVLKVKVGVIVSLIRIRGLRFLGRFVKRRWKISSMSPKGVSHKTKLVTHLLQFS